MRTQIVDWYFDVQNVDQRQKSIDSGQPAQVSNSGQPAQADLN